MIQVASLSLFYYNLQVSPLFLLTVWAYYMSTWTAFSWKNVGAVDLRSALETEDKT